MAWASPLLYFTDPILRAPTLGCMLMGLAAALVGVIVLLRRQSLLGESLAHASYPGVIIGILLAASFVPDVQDDGWLSIVILGGAFCSALLGLWCIEWLQRSMRVRYDSALCFVLASFFGIGITMASRVQFTHTALYRQIQIYLYGQAATMRDFHILLYLGMALLVIISISLTYRRLQILLLDREFAHTLGMRTRTLNTFFFLLIVLAIIVGIRCVGVVLMSAMLIAPAATARQFTHRLWQVMILAGLVGMLSGFLGNYLSVELARSWGGADGGRGFALPTGPSVVLTGSALCFLALLFAPERGLVVRYLRILVFRQRCVRENLLKALWRAGEYRRVPATELRRYYSGPRLYLKMLLRRMIQDGLVATSCGRTYTLTDAGRRQGAHIVRLHRLWELYLVDQLGIGAERVHRSAEEIEHILTPELERQLTQLLDNPVQDPHAQPIPPSNEEPG